MAARRLNIAILILVIGTCAFVMDVLSPITPTPTAQVAAKTFVVAMSFLLVLAYFWGTLIAGIQPLRIAAAPPSSAKCVPRTVLALICFLLI